MWRIKMDVSSSALFLFFDRIDRIKKEIESKPVIPPATPLIEKKKTHVINIFYKNETGLNSNIGYTHPYTEGERFNKCSFFNLYQWFYQRRSPYFTFWHRTGYDILVRSLISKIKVFIQEE
jgi:hypothetical protein